MTTPIFMALIHVAAGRPARPACEKRDRTLALEVSREFQAPGPATWSASLCRQEGRRVPPLLRSILPPPGSQPRSSRCRPSSTRFFISAMASPVTAPARFSSFSFPAGRARFIWGLATRVFTMAPPERTATTQDSTRLISTLRALMVAAVAPPQLRSLRRSCCSGQGCWAWFLYGVRSSDASSARPWCVTQGNHASWPVSERQARPG